MTTPAHQGRNTTFLDSVRAGTITTRNEARFLEIKDVNDVVSTKPRVGLQAFSLIVSRGLGWTRPPLRFREKLSKDPTPPT